MYFIAKLCFLKHDKPPLRKVFFFRIKMFKIMISVDKMPYPKVKNFLPSKNNVKHFSTLSLDSYCLILRTSINILFNSFMLAAFYGTRSRQ